jgi:hypothetical protein
VQVEGATLGFLHQGDPAAKHALLKVLMERGLPVTGLSEDLRNLQHSYLATFAAPQASMSER